MIVAQSNSWVISDSTMNITYDKIYIQYTDKKTHAYQDTKKRLSSRQRPDHHRQTLEQPAATEPSPRGPPASQ